MAAVSAPMPGIAAGAYRNTGTTGSPTWTEMTSVLSASGFADNWDFDNASKRATLAKLYDKTQVDLNGTLRVLADPAATDYAALYAASQIRTAIVDLMVLNGKVTIEGAIGVRAGYKLKRTQSQGEGDVIYDEFECFAHMSGASPVTPSTVVMGASSAPTFTTL